MKKNKSKKNSKELKEDKETTKSIIYIAVALIIIFGLLLLSKPITELVYKTKQKQILKDHYGFIFAEIEGLWKTHIQNQETKNIYEISLHYAPWELEDLPVKGDPLKFFNLLEINDLNAIYVTFTLPSQQNTYLALAGAELSINLARGLNITPVSACTKNITEECKKKPIVDCTKDNALVIEFQENNETGIYVNKNCLVIRGNEMDLVKAVDKLLYLAYRIPVVQNQ